MLYPVVNQYSATRSWPARFHESTVVIQPGIVAESDAKSNEVNQMKVHVIYKTSTKDISYEIAAWLANNPTVTIRFVSQSQDAAGWITYIILYDDAADSIG